jgi:hypothetical protein
MYCEAVGLVLSIEFWGMLVLLDRSRKENKVLKSTIPLRDANSISTAHNTHAFYHR